MKPIITKTNKYVLCFLLLSIQTVSYGGWPNLFKKRAPYTLMQNTDAIDTEIIEAQPVSSVDNIVCYANPAHESLLDYPKDLLFRPTRKIPLQEAITLSSFMKTYRSKQKYYRITNNYEAIAFMLDALAVERDLSLYNDEMLEGAIDYILEGSVTYSENLSYAQFLFQYLSWRSCNDYTHSSLLAKIKNQTAVMHSENSIIFKRYNAIYGHIKLNFLKLVKQAGLKFPKEVFCGPGEFLS